MTDGWGDGRTKGRVFNPKGRGGAAGRSTNVSLYDGAKDKWPIVKDVPTDAKGRWQTEALCGQPHERNYWFPRELVGNDLDRQRAQHRQTAKAYCAQCPVLAACAAFAKATRPTDGIWAGVEYGNDGPKTDQTEELF